MAAFPSSPASSARFLSAREIEALSASCDFARALPNHREQIVTTEIPQGAEEERLGLQAWDARGLSSRDPGWRFAGKRLIPAVPEADRKYWPESEWADSTESFDFMVHGVLPWVEGAEGAPFLLFRDLRSPFGAELFVAMASPCTGQIKLHGARELGASVFRVFRQSVPALDALDEAEDLRDAVPGAPGAAEGGRL